MLGMTRRTAPRSNGQQSCSNPTYSVARHLQVEERQAFKLDADSGAPKGFIKPNIEGCFTIAIFIAYMPPGRDGIYVSEFVSGAVRRAQPCKGDIAFRPCYLPSLLAGGSAVRRTQARHPAPIECPQLAGQSLGSSTSLW